MNAGDFTGWKHECADWVPGLIRSKDWEREAESTGGEEQMGKWDIEPKEEDDGFKQSSKREERRTGQIHSVAIKPQQNVTITKIVNKQTVQQRMIFY